MRIGQFFFILSVKISLVLYQIIKWYILLIKYLAKIKITDLEMIPFFRCHSLIHKIFLLYLLLQTLKILEDKISKNEWLVFTFLFLSSLFQVLLYLKIQFNVVASFLTSYSICFQFSFSRLYDLKIIYFIIIIY